MDSNGYPHIIYSENVEYEYYYKNSWNNTAFHLTNNIKYATWTGSSWSIQTVVSNASYIDGIGNLVLSSKGAPHLCYIHENFTYLPDYGTFIVKNTKLCFLGGSAWLVQAIDSKPYNIMYEQPDLKLDSNGNPQVYFYKEDYQNTTDSGLMNAKLTGSNWNIQTIGSHDFNDIALDSHGNPHITYATVVGSIHGAYRYGNLTYATLETALILNPTSLLTIITVTTAVCIILMVLFIVYRARHKAAKGLLRATQPSEY